MITMDEGKSENVCLESSEQLQKQNDENLSEQVKEKKTKDEKGRRKEERAIEQALKALSGIEKPDEKLLVMCKKYSELLEENRKLNASLKQSEKRVSMVLREKEQLQSERNKAVLSRSRMESLCRELQKQNKAVKEESLQKIREEEEKRKEVSAKFQSTLAEITTLMNQTNEKNAKMFEESTEMNKKFNSVYEQVTLREQQILGVQQSLQKELKASEASKIKLAEEKTELLKEKQQLLLKLSECQVQIKELQETEIGLRTQISMYTDKYDEFQSALTRSNQVFGGFNEEIEKMSKKILKLEKETSLWKQRWENSHAALLEMVSEKNLKDEELKSLNKKLSLLQELCKVFQRDRSTLLAQLRGANVSIASGQSCPAISADSVEQQMQNVPNGFHRDPINLQTIEALTKATDAEQLEVESLEKKIEECDALKNGEASSASEKVDETTGATVECCDKSVENAKVVSDNKIDEISKKDETEKLTGENIQQPEVNPSKLEAESQEKQNSNNSSIEIKEDNSSQIETMKKEEEIEQQTVGVTDETKGSDPESSSRDASITEQSQQEQASNDNLPCTEEKSCTEGNSKPTESKDAEQSPIDAEKSNDVSSNPVPPQPVKKGKDNKRRKR